MKITHKTRTKIKLTNIRVGRTFVDDSGNLYMKIDGFFGPDDIFYTAVDLVTAKIVSFHGMDQSFLTVNCELIVEAFAS